MLRCNGCFGASTRTSHQDALITRSFFSCVPECGSTSTPQTPAPHHWRRGVSIPLLHISDATAGSIKAKRLRSPGLMATRFTMEETFYTERLIAAGLAPIIPEDADRNETHRIIYEELCRDIVRAESEAGYVRIAGRLVARGADCLILGCNGGRHAAQ